MKEDVALYRQSVFRRGVGFWFPADVPKIFPLICADFLADLRRVHSAGPKTEVWAK